MVELAKTHISITDDSASGAGVDTLIPLYIFATEQDKVVDSATGEIATGTVKDLAGEISIVTSRQDVVNKFGIPNFVQENGTISQGNELNEVGLYALYDAMGSASVAYALRADIDLKQLNSVEAEPTSKVKNGTKWMDLRDTSFGIAVANDSRTPAKRWQTLDEITVIESADDPITSYGDYAVCFSDEGDTKVLSLYEAGVNNWVKVEQSADWNGASGLHSGAKIYIGSSTLYPGGTTNCQGSIWIKTNSVNNGVDYGMKNYNSSMDIWSDVSVPLVNSFIEAEQTFGTSLVSGVICAKYDVDTASRISTSADIKFYKFTSINAGLTLSSSYATSNVIGNVSVETSDGKVTLTIDEVAGISVDDVASRLNVLLAQSKLKYISVSTATVDSNKVLTIKENGSKSFVVSSETTGTLKQLGLTSSDSIKKIECSGCWNGYKSFTVSSSEPKLPALDGTLWFNDDLSVDIMVNSGSEWKGYNSMFADAKIYVTSSEPVDATENSIWVNTADSNYPTIRVWDSEASEWILRDNTDQTTPYGVVFADARYFAKEGDEFVEPTFLLVGDGQVSSNLLTSDAVDPDCPNPQTYPAGILLFNTRFSSNNVKEYKSDAFEGLYQADGEYTVGGYTGNVNDFSYTDGKPSTARWVSASGNSLDGSGLFGRKAQRAMVVKALQSAIVSNEDIRTNNYDFFFANCAGYPEVDDELIALNVDKKEMFEIISDTPARLAPNGKTIQDWATNANNAASHGEDGRVLRNAYVVRQYPSMGLGTNVDGSEVAVPSSVSKMKDLLVLPRGQICAGTQNGQVINLSSVGYINAEEEYAPISLSDGLGEILVAQSINPIMSRRGTGLLHWGERTEYSTQESSLADEHAIITLLRLKRDLEITVQPFFFRINNEALRNDFRQALANVLNTYIKSGEINDYTLVTDSSVNTNERINRRELWGAIAIEIARGTEQIYLPIHIVATGALS